MEIDKINCKILEANIKNTSVVINKPIRVFFNLNNLRLLDYSKLFILFFRVESDVTYYHTALKPLWLILLPFSYTIFFTNIFNKFKNLLESKIPLTNSIVTESIRFYHLSVFQSANSKTNYLLKWELQNAYK